MRAFGRDLLALGRVYVIGALITLGWVVLGIYISLRPVSSTSSLGVDANRELGLTFVAQGFISFMTFVATGALRVADGNREDQEKAKDRQQLREIHQWMEEQRKLDAASTPPGLSIANGHGAMSEGKMPHVN